jgi:hypothetical protein
VIGSQQIERRKVLPPFYFSLHDKVALQNQIQIAELVAKIFAHYVSFSRTETEQYIETARAALGDKAYIAAFESGKQMNLDEAVAYALKELQ